MCGFQSLFELLCRPVQCDFVLYRTIINNVLHGISADRDREGISGYGAWSAYSFTRIHGGHIIHYNFAYPLLAYYIQYTRSIYIILFNPRQRYKQHNALYTYVIASFVLRECVPILNTFSKIILRYTYMCVGLEVFTTRNVCIPGEENMFGFIVYLIQLDVETPLFYLAGFKDRCVSIYTGFTLVWRASRQDRGGGGCGRGLADAHIVWFTLKYK